MKRGPGFSSGRGRTLTSECPVQCLLVHVVAHWSMICLQGEESSAAANKGIPHAHALPSHSHLTPFHHIVTPSSHTSSQTPQQSQYAEEAIPVLTAAERARTVNAKGEYIDHRYISSFRSSNSHFDGTLHSGYFSLSVSLREARSLVTCAEPPTLLPDCHPLPLPPPPLPPPN